MATNVTPVILMKDITKTYCVGSEEVHALNKATISVARGEFVSLTGPSGSGKSTLMSIIGCLDVADSGGYILEGQNIHKYSNRQLDRIRNRKIGFVFQSFNLLSRMTALENVELPLIYQGLRYGERKERAHSALKRVNLTNRSDHKPTELSGGQQQRVAIARAIATNPAILLADEPTGNLDSKTGADIIELFQELHSAGNTIMLITHDEKVAKQAQRCIYIIDGRVEEEC